MRANLYLEFEVGDRVRIDHGDVTGIVTAIRVLSTNPRLVVYQVGWMHAGDAKSAEFDEWRLEDAE